MQDRSRYGIIGYSDSGVCSLSDNPGGLKGSTQHWPAVYPPEFEIPRFVVAGY
jgi:hypothetical protein